MKKDLVVGVHSIAHVVLGDRRPVYELIATEDGIEKLQKMGGLTRAQIAKLPVKLVSPHKLQEDALKLYNEMDYQFTRVPSGLLMVTSEIEVENPTWINDQLESGRHLKILCLDGITDVHNAAAIMRTAAFYDVDCVVVAMKNNFGLGPSVARIASGAIEYVKVVRCSSLPKFLNSMSNKGVEAVGLTEHTEDTSLEPIQGSRCLVLGAEDKGLSNAVERIITKKIRLSPQGKIESLNVSVAAAIAMERVFS